MGIEKGEVLYLLGDFDQLVVVYASGTGQHNIGSFVVSADVVLKVLSSDGLDILSGAENSHAEWSALVGDRMKMIKHNLLEVSFHL